MDKMRKIQTLKEFFAVTASAVLIFIVVVAGTAFYEYQSLVNKNRFGAWFILENSVNLTQSAVLKNNSYFASQGKIINVTKYYDKNYTEKDYRLGCVDNEAFKLGNFTLEKGKMPSEDNEIAIEKDTLLSLGFSDELGQSITVYYYDLSDGGNINTSKKSSREYVVTGILNNYSAYWDGAEYVPTMIVTEQEADSYGFAKSQTVLYGLDESAKEKNYKSDNTASETNEYEQFYKEIKMLAETTTVYNSRVYGYDYFDTTDISTAADIFAVFSGLLLCMAALIAYLRCRYDDYKADYDSGINKFAVCKNAVLEQLVIGLSGVICGIVIGVLGIVFVKRTVSLLKTTLLLKIVALLLCGCVILAVITFICVYKSLISQKKDKPVSAIKRKIVIAFSGLYLIAVVVVLSFCAKQVADAKNTFDNLKLKSDYIVGQDVNLSSSSARLSKSTYIENGGYTSDISEGEADSVYTFMLRENFVKGNTLLYDYISKNTVQELENVYGVDTVDTKTVEAGQVCFEWNNESAEYEVYKNENEIDDMYNYLIANGFEQIYEGEVISMYYDYLTANGIGQMYQGALIGTYDGMVADMVYYVEPTQEVFEELKSYFGEDYSDYEAFANGEQAIVFLSQNAAGFYNMTIKAGDTIRMYNPWVYGGIDSDKDYVYDRKKTAVSRLFSKYIKANRSSFGNDFEHYSGFVTAANVVYVNDEILADLKSKLPVLEFINGKSMLVMSTEYAKKVYNDNMQRMCDVLGEDLGSMDYDSEYGGNIAYINCGVEAVYSAADNVITAYLDSKGLNYVSNFEENNAYRKDYLYQKYFYIVMFFGTLVFFICSIPVVRKI